MISTWQHAAPVVASRWRSSLVVRWAFRDGPRAVRRALGDLELPPYDATRCSVPRSRAWLAKRLPAAYEPIVRARRTGYEP